VASSYHGCDKRTIKAPEHNYPYALIKE